MLSSIHIQGFKGFKDTKIEPLRRVNLIVGGQNSGKTSLLEAIYAGPSHRMVSNKYYDIEDSKSSLLEYQPVVDVVSYVQNGEEQSRLRVFEERVYLSKLREVPFDRAEKWFKTVNSDKILITSTSTPPVYSREKIISIVPNKINEAEVVGLFENVSRQEKEDYLLSFLKKIEPKLNAIRVLSPEGEDKSLKILHANLSLGRMIPHSILGEGFNRLVYIFCSLLSTDAKIVVIDELENGIHYSVLPDVWRGIDNISRELGIQIFLTTHSYECIQAAAKVFEATSEEFQVIRLERTEDNVDAKCIPGDRVASVLERGWEIR
jgi:predicted ATP-dependent endonuclease of OLD family